MCVCVCGCVSVWVWLLRPIMPKMPTNKTNWHWGCEKCLCWAQKKHFVNDLHASSGSAGGKCVKISAIAKKIDRTFCKLVATEKRLSACDWGSTDGELGKHIERGFHGISSELNDLQWNTFNLSKSMQYSKVLQSFIYGYIKRNPKSCIT